ncbi:peptidoglycan editing factor PgeF [Yinghuangia sp. ASG 101]|uniref:peptidoglycan editing factor PgeF n=1 Tax=Yinghuangia sp. ASG 101 TaxID=2896848 RepID=UPI001E5E8730|nr:peptidoglycan editing factor PgeF [Yinghuangia sp. ASG 101]UGQ10064.1 peptidoglycan editing factor PgeF [Yinghuangia sp. ASG 101]
MFSLRSEEHGVHFAFTDRWGGVGAAPYDELNLGAHVGDEPRVVRDNRARAAAALGLDGERVVWMNQVHGRNVVAVDGPWPGEVPEADAVVTRTPGLGLAVLVADCTPALLADPVAGVVAAAHAGRPGLFAGVIPATIEAMVGFGARPERIIAKTGPAVCGPCYEVPDAMCDEVAARVPRSRARTREGTAALDIVAGVWAQLAEAGVTVGEKSHICTRESADHFSYRRDGKTGRIAGYVWLAETPAAPGAPASGSMGT